MPGTGIEGLTWKELKTALEAAEREGIGADRCFPEMRAAAGHAVGNSRFPAGRSAAEPVEAASEAAFEATSETESGALWRLIREEGRLLAEKPMSVLPFSEFLLFDRTGDRAVFAEKYNDRRRRLAIFGLLAWRELAEGQAAEGGTGDGAEKGASSRWLKPLEDAIWAVCEETTWVSPAHVGLYHPQYPEGIWDRPEPPRETVDLFAAETAFALAELSSLLGERLHPWIVLRIRSEIGRRIFDVYFGDPVPQNWELKVNNWPAVCAAGIGAAAIYLERDSERLSGMLWRVLGAMRRHIDGFDADGATAEGASYWQYGFGYFIYLAELVKERTSGRVSLAEGEKIRRIAGFPAACLLTGNRVINFSDASDTVDFHAGLLGRLRRIFPGLPLPQPGLSPAPGGNWITLSRLLMWTDRGGADAPLPERVGGDESRSERANAVPPQEGGSVRMAGSGETAADSPNGRRNEDYLFAGHQWVVAKTHAPEGNTVFAAKGGYNDEPHNHNDLGHFILHVRGETVLIDPGAGLYTRQYFQPRYRYEEITAGSHGHSVPEIDGLRQSYGASFRAELLTAETEEDAVRCAFDLTRAYPPEAGLEKLVRHFRWERPSAGPYRLVLRDDVRWSGGARRLTEVLIAGVQPVPEEEGRVRIGPVTARYDASRFGLRIEPVTYAQSHGTERTIYRVLFDSVPLPEAGERAREGGTIAEIVLTVESGSEAGNSR